MPITNNKFYLDYSIADKLGMCLFRYEFGPEEKFSALNPNIAKILGYPSFNEILPLKFKSLFKHPEETDNFFNLLKKEKIARSYKALFKTKDGLDKWVKISASLIESYSDKNLKYMEGALEDITHHKEIEDNLLLEKRLFQNLLDNIPDAVYFKDDKNRLIRVNRFYAEGFKLPTEKIIGKTDFDFFPKPQAQKMFDDDTYVLKTGKPIIGKIERTLLPNGTYNCVTTTKVPIYNKKGGITGTMGITRDITAYDRMEKTRLGMVMNSLSVLDKILETKDPYTFGHTRRVSIIVEKIAEELGWEENRILELKLCAELHDIGKILIPLEILNKPGKLSILEHKMIQEHAKQSYDMLKPYSFPYPLSEAIYQHHERLDGNGYPRGLSGNDIIPEARLLAISDVLEAMLSHRPYREALGMGATMNELKENAGSKYDQAMVDAALKIINENNNKPFWLNSNPPPN